MSVTITTLVMMAMILTVGLAVARSAFMSVGYVAQSWKEMESTTMEVVRTDISVVDAGVAGAFVEVMVQNSGSVHISMFSDWDVLIHYYDDTGNYFISRMQYSEQTDPGENQWSVVGIYTDDTMTKTEVYEPGILNAGEVARLRLNVVPSVGVGTTSWVIVSTPGGVTTSVQFYT